MLSNRRGSIWSKKVFYSCNTPVDEAGPLQVRMRVVVVHIIG